MYRFYQNAKIITKSQGFVLKIKRNSREKKYYFLKLQYFWPKISINV